MNEQKRPTQTAFLEAAARLGDELCRRAYWDRHARFCNWVGRSPLEGAIPGMPVLPTAGALGPDLYGGSAGIALFLSQLHALRPNEVYCQTAVAALKRSVRWLKEAVPTPPLSFFSGHLGVAYVCSRVATLVDDATLTDAADNLLARVRASVGEPHVLDLIGGNAGAIPALLRLSRTPGWQGCMGVAEQLGEELCRTALRDGEVWAWDAEQASGPGIGKVPLTGLAHGAAGMAVALLELYGATGREDFLKGARGAFAYEDRTFSPERKNWPDLRRLVAGVQGIPGYATAWCHGAPGIALARLRAATLDPAQSSNHTAAADVALATTRLALEGTPPLSRKDATLCHGAIGLTEILLSARQLGSETDLGELARQQSLTLLRKHLDTVDWPCGTATGGFNPSLMLGIAGIGYHFLRLHDPTTVSPLLLTEVDPIG